MAVKNKIFLTVAFLFIMVSSVWAGTFTLDPKYTSIAFRIKHLMGYTTGYFPKFDGKIVLNKENRAVTAIEGTIDVTAIFTRLKERDDDLRSERFFYVEKFPEAKFVSTKITNSEVTGNLTLRGVTKPVKFKYEFWGTAYDQFGNTKTAVTLKGSVDRKDFGMDYNLKTEDGTMLLGEDVEFTIELHGILQR